MVCIEAMAQGAIVIGSNSGGMSEIMEDGRSGFLLPPKQPDLWANKILEITGIDIDKVTSGKIAEHSGAANTFETFLEHHLIRPV